MKSVFSEAGLMVVAQTVCRYVAKGNSKYTKFLEKKCESDKYYLWGIYEELCLIHNKVVREEDLDILQFNGDTPEDFIGTELGEEITRKFYRDTVQPHEELFVDNPTVEVLRSHYEETGNTNGQHDFTGHSNHAWCS